MLLTRCPDCQTNFRITADLLRKADGQVKCGHCMAVFNACAELADNGPAELDGEPPADVSTDTNEHLVLEAPQALGESEELEEPEDPEEPEESEELDESEEPDEAAQAGDTDPGEDAPKASLEFDLPPDEWTSFFRFVEENPLAGDLPQGAGLPEEQRETAEDPEEMIVRDISEDAEADDSIATEDAAQVQPGQGHTEDVGLPGLKEAAASLAGPGTPAEELSSEPSGGLEEIITAEEVDATLSEDSDAETDDLTTDPVPGAFHRLTRLSPHRWSIGSALLFLLLAGQTVHHFRAGLAAQPVIGPLLQIAYEQGGSELTPTWDLSQYEIMDWVAAADAGSEEQGILRITARIRNRGPRAQPYPSVHLELKDRWEAAVGSRVFEPEEYLPEDLTRDRLMEVGVTVPASLAVVDPGQDAYGFELDICVELQAGQLACASDTIFQ